MLKTRAGAIIGASRNELDTFPSFPGFPGFHPLQVLSDNQLAALEGVSLDTIQRRRAKGDAPPRVQLSERRHGTLMQDYATWLASKREDQEIG